MFLTSPEFERGASPYAHSLAGRPESEWETLAAHLQAVAGTAARFAEVFGGGALAEMAGRLHDIGKCSREFQLYIGSDEAEGRRGPDHSSAGAREALAILSGPLGKLVAFAVAGHHAGLADWPSLEARLTKELPPYEGWRAHAGPLPTPCEPPRRFRPSAESGFSLAFLTRMIFSCLVDADRLETAAFDALAARLQEESPSHTSLAELRGRLLLHMERTAAAAARRATTDRQRLLAEQRQAILTHALAKAELPPGFFTLTVPTGGGKTLASLSFALEHAVRRGLRRVVYVIPFTSILEQSAAVFREALGPSPEAPNEGDVLEHHSAFDWEAALKAAGEDGRGTGPVAQLQRAAENWDVPIVVTTAVQFFESLFSNRPSACRKLHNLAGSVIVLDEAQTLPLRILRPALAALDELQRNYGASIVLCTATQPAWRKLDGKLVQNRGKSSERDFGLDVPTERELAPDPAALFEALKRVEVAYRPEPIADDVVAARFGEQAQMLCIVNSRRHARALFDRIGAMDGAIHLSTWMCPRHRRLVLERARADLREGKPVRIVSTSLIEAGVDIDFPEVWRAATGLDGILQAAGRCNREFNLPAGRVVVFLPVEDKGPHDLQQAWQAGRSVLRRHADDPQTLAAISDYFGELYFNRGEAALDASKLEGKDYPILVNIRERKDGTFPFESIARAFKVIEDAMEPVIVPWSAGADDTDARDLLNAIGAMEKPSRAMLRRLQQYTVTIPKKQRDAWLTQDVLRPVHQSLGEAMLCIPPADLPSYYDERSGLRLDEALVLAPGATIIGP